MNFTKDTPTLNHTLQLFLKVVKKLALSFIILLAFYLAFSIILSAIPVNCNKHEEGEIDIYIKSNGVHLDIILPLKNEQKNWSEELQINNRIEQLANYVSFGWGDKGFFINAPQWSDLTFRTAFKALFKKSPSAMHIDFYRNLEISSKCRKISMSKEQYTKLVKYIEQSMSQNNNGDLIIIEGLTYYGYDCFYEAEGTYNLFFTCNSWSNRALKVAGLKASLWTPFDKGTLFHYRK